MVLASLLLPLVPHLPLLREGLSPVVIQYLPNFWTLRRAGYVSNGDLALIEIATGLWLLAKLANFVAFRRRLVACFSDVNPPPLDLKDRWPVQFSKIIAFGLVLTVLPFALAPLRYALGALSPRYALYIVALFGGGCMALSEGLASLALYRTFKVRFWPGLESGLL
ncbi:hypothetical protein [Bradyrhizobium sp. LTSPM299]|uniref:hypothetical protein n=1 Tax=Bradyrhizobium sp. LTSPM299 TaxID=1619233 RepID=UPI000A4C2160|nr:hypothetical protein [Bradyrhizobium sp. LTSPM299]